MRNVGEWEILERIGIGSFSTVWKARHRRTNQLAAVKEVTPTKVSADVAKCLNAELTAMREMNHSNIVAFYEQIRVTSTKSESTSLKKLAPLLKDKGQLFIVMEFCKDGELESVIRKGRCSEQFTRKCLAQLAAGLKALRSAKIIHRDLKPANLLLSDGVLKIADFGFARNLPSKSLADTLCGSPLYMAPEVLQRKKYDARADLWSVGVIFYEMLVGKTPFEGQNYIHLLSNIETKPLRIPKSVAKAVSNECLDLMVRLLQRDPHKRIDFDVFFKHPFITETVQNTTPPEPVITSELNAVAETSASSMESEDAFSFSADGDFIVVHRHGSPGADDAEIDAKQKRLKHVAEWVMIYAQESVAPTKRFFLSLISVQILRHLLNQNARCKKDVQAKHDEAIATAQLYSEELSTTDVTAKCEAQDIYRILWTDAIAFAKKAAADELCGQFSESAEQYERSLEITAFLLEEGSGVPLNPPLILSNDQKENLTELRNQIEYRRAKCTSSTIS